LAIFRFDGDDEEEVLETLMMADVDVSDIECEDGKITVFAPHTEFFKVKTALTEANSDIKFDVEEITFVAQTEAQIEDEDDLANFDKFMNMLEDCDDVQHVYHNAVLPE
jgi:transcriptional/translational regulatory protein YebC/TACO1